MLEDQPETPIREQAPDPLAQPPLVEAQPDATKGAHYGFHMLLGFGTFYGLLASTAGVLGGFGARSPWAILPATLLIALSVFAKRRLRSRGFVIGALIGLGLLALAAGLCIGIIRAS
jgi:hypothetical protein